MSSRDALEQCERVVAAVLQILERCTGRALIHIRRRWVWAMASSRGSSAGSLASVVTHRGAAGVLPVDERVGTEQREPRPDRAATALATSYSWFSTLPGRFTSGAAREPE